MYYCDVEWFALEVNRDHYVVFEIASIALWTLVDNEVYYVSLKGFLLTVVDIVVI